MEMEPKPKKLGVVGAELEQDRLSSLPDDLLHSILGVLTLKQSARTSALSRRWSRMWLHALAASAVLDFTDRDFVRGQSPAQIVATVNRCLDVHGAAPIDAFRVAFSPFDAFRLDIVHWVVGRGARELALNLTHGGVLDANGHAFIDVRAAVELPGGLFNAENSLARLRLGRCGLRHVPPDAAGLAGLTSLSLCHVDVTDDAVRDVVSGCRLLEFLSLRNCHRLASVRIAGVRLRGLELVCCLAVRELHVAAPALESFAFHGDIIYFRDEDAPASPINFIGEGDTTTPSEATPALRDAYLSHVGFGEYDETLNEFAYSSFLEMIAHAKILTICSVGLLHISETRLFYELGMYFPNLEELQLLMDTMGDDDLTRLSGFFEWEAPLHPRAASDSGDAGQDADIVLEYEIVLHQLSFIKVVNFRGTRCELRMLRFFLQRAPALDQLVLVTPEEEEANPGDADQQQSGSLHIKIIQGQVSTMRKASVKANVTVCRPREDRSLNPAHTRYYHEEKCSPGTVRSLNIAPSLGAKGVVLN